MSDRGDRVFPRLPHVMRVLIGLKIRHSDLLRLFDYFGFMFFDDHLKTVLRTLTFNCCFIDTKLIKAFISLLVTPQIGRARRH